MASGEGVQNCELVGVRLQLEGSSIDVIMEAGEMKSLPAEAMAAIKTRAEEMLLGRSLVRLTYMDEDGDQCTLTESSIHDALTFATLGTEGIWVLQVSVLAEPPPAPEQVVPVQAPPAAPADAVDVQLPEVVPVPPEEPTEATDDQLPEEPPRAPAEAPAAAPAAPALRSLEVHMTVACDGCDQSPILGKRFKCLQCLDYDLCERCFKRNCADYSIHAHEGWARIQADSHVTVRGDVESAELVSHYEHPSKEVTASHVDVTCNGCQANPIVGSRFKCTTVPDYNLCAKCYAHRAEISPHAGQPFEELVVAPVVPGAAVEPQVQTAPTPELGTGGAGAARASAHGQRCPPLSASEGSSALKALAFHLEDDLCLLALEALMEHPDERLRMAAAAVASAAAASAAASPEPPRPEVAMPELEAKAEPEAEAEDEPKAEDVSVAVEEEKGELKPEDVSMVVEEAQAPEAGPSARVLSSSPLVLGVEAGEDEAARGDVTAEFEEALRRLASAEQAYRCGRMALPAAEAEGTVPAEAKLIIINDGSVPWPEAACLSIVMGDPFGLASMGLGPMQPGEAAEVILDLNVPQKNEPSLARSAWSLMDAATGESFGPLIFFEVVWMKV